MHGKLICIKDRTRKYGYARTITIRQKVRYKRFRKTVFGAGTQWKGKDYG
jgi:hypothetical protein